MPKVIRQPDSPLLRQMLARQQARAGARRDYLLMLADADTLPPSVAVARRAVDREFRRVEKGR